MIGYKQFYKTALVATALSVATLFPKVGMAIEITVEIANFAFEPIDITINPGDIVIWINRDIVPHTATANDMSWDTGEIKPGESAQLEFAEETIREYFCIYHPMMSGKL